MYKRSHPIKKVTRESLDLSKALFKMGIKPNKIAGVFGFSRTTFERMKKSRFDFNKYHKITDETFKPYKSFVYPEPTNSMDLLVLAACFTVAIFVVAFIILK